MPQLLVERGHAGRAWGDSKGWRSRCRLRYGADDDGDGWLAPRRHPPFSENLSPLYRYLETQVGRPWDAVYGEIRRHIDASNTVQHHILQHLYDRLAVQVTEDDSGRLWTVGRWGGPVQVGARWGPHLYVCPRTGLLRRFRRRDVPPAPPARVDRLPGPTPDNDYRLIAGQWYAVWWGRDPESGAAVIARKRQLGRRALRDLGIRR